jgi:outer membrane lipoprotein-sorting protein
MNNQSLILLAIGAFVALIVTVAAVDQYLLDEHPPTEVEGLIWRVENAFSRIQDLEATLQVTDESRPVENVRMKVRYVKGPHPVLSMRYVPPQDANEDLFISSVRDETFTIQNDQLFHYIPSEDIIVSKRWPGVPLVMVGLGLFDISGIHSDWIAGKTEIRILQDISDFSGVSFATSLAIFESFSDAPAALDMFPNEGGLRALPSYALTFSFYPDLQLNEPHQSDGLESSLFSENGTSASGSYILEIRDAISKDLLRMIWINRETYLIQKVVTFKGGQRSATLMVQLITIDQGLSEADVIPPLQVGVENIRG